VSLLISTSINGLHTGTYVVAINTNSIGENWVELALLLGSIPSVFYFFVRGLVGLFKQARIRKFDTLSEAFIEVA
jgi:hypothetical protein